MKKLSNKTWFVKLSRLWKKLLTYRNENKLNIILTKILFLNFDELHFL